MASTEAKFLEGSLLKHITVMSVTAAIGLLALFVVDLVDMLFISMIGNAELAAAVGFSGSILFFTTSISIGVSIAAGALVAQAIGKGNTLGAQQIMTHILLLGVIVSTIFVVIIWNQLENLTALTGASGQTQVLAINYLKIIIPTMPLMMCGIIAAATLRSYGEATLSTLSTLAAGFVNAVLDPIFIFGFNMGLEGAAWATAISRLAMVVVAFWPIYRKYGGLSPISLPKFISDIKPIFAIALPAILANVATPIGNAYVTRMSAQFGQDAVAGMAAIGRLTPIAFTLIFALSGAIGPIIGQNFGAGKYDRVRQAFNESMLFIIIYVACVVIILFALRTQIVDLFGLQGAGRDLVLLFCGPLSLAWIFNGIIFVSNASFNNLGHPFYSTWVNWGRNTIGIIPFVWIGANLADAEGVLIGQMAGGIFVAMISWWLALSVIKKAGSLSETELENPVFSKHRRLFSLLNHRR